MRKLLYSILFVGALIACEKDEIEFLDAELKKTEAELQAAIDETNDYVDWAFTVLAQLVHNEEQARIAGDNHLAQTLGVVKQQLQNLIAAAVAASEAGDAALEAELQVQVERLGTLIEEEAELRVAGDLANANALAEAVAQLSNAIQAANNARIAGDAQLQSNLNSAVSALNAAIDAEASARAAGDAALTTEIANVRTELASAVLDLQAADAAEALARAQGDDANAAAIAQAEADLTAAIDAARAAAVQGDADTLSTAQRRLRNTRNALQAQIDTNTNAIAALQTAVDSLNNSVPALETAVSVLTSGTSLDLSNLTTRISELEALVNANAVTADSEIDRVLDALNDAIAELNTAIEDGDFDIENYVSDLEDDLRDAIEKIAALENNQVTLQQVLDLISQLDLEHDAANNQLQATLDTLSSTLANLSIPSEFDDSALTAAIADLQAQIDAIDTSGSGNVDLTDINNAIQALQDRVNNLYNNVCAWNGIDESVVLQQSINEEITETKTYIVEETSTECGITRNVEVEVTVTETNERLANKDANGDGDMEDAIFVHQLSDGTRMERVVDYAPVADPEFDTNMTAFLNTLSEDDTFEYDGRTIIYAGVSYQGKVWALESHANNNHPDYGYVYIVEGPNGIGLHDNSLTAFQNRNSGGDLTSAEAAAEVLEVLFASRDITKYLTNVRIAGTPTGNYGYAAAFDWAAHQDELSNITVTSTLTDFRRLGTVVDFNAPNDVEQITFTFTSTDYEGSVTVTLDNPAYKMLITDKYRVQNGSAAHRRNIQPVQGSIQGARNGTFTVSPGASATWDGGGTYEVNIFFDTPLIESAEVTFIHPDYRGELVFTVANPNYDANWKQPLSEVFSITGTEIEEFATGSGYVIDVDFDNVQVDSPVTRNETVMTVNGVEMTQLGYYEANGQVGFFDSTFDIEGTETVEVTFTNPNFSGEVTAAISNPFFKPEINDVFITSSGSAAHYVQFNTQNGYQFGGTNGYWNSTISSKLSISVSTGGRFLGFNTRGTSELGFGFDDNGVQEITVTLTHTELRGELVFTVTNENYDPVDTISAAIINDGTYTENFVNANGVLFRYDADVSAALDAASQAFTVRYYVSDAGTAFRIYNADYSGANGAFNGLYSGQHGTLIANTVAGAVSSINYYSN